MPIHSRQDLQVAIVCFAAGLVVLVLAIQSRTPKPTVTGLVADSPPSRVYQPAPQPSPTAVPSNAPSKRTASAKPPSVPAAEPPTAPSHDASLQDQALTATPGPKGAETTGASQARGPWAPPPAPTPASDRAPEPPQSEPVRSEPLPPAPPPKLTPGRYQVRMRDLRNGGAIASVVEAHITPYETTLVWLFKNPRMSPHKRQDKR